MDSPCNRPVPCSESCACAAKAHLRPKLVLLWPNGKTDTVLHLDLEAGRDGLRPTIGERAAYSAMLSALRRTGR